MSWLARYVWLHCCLQLRCSRSQRKYGLLSKVIVSHVVVMGVRVCWQCFLQAKAAQAAH